MLEPVVVITGCNPQTGQVLPGTYLLHTADRMLKNADGYIKAALQTSYADLFMPVEVSCSIKMMLDGKLRSFKTKLCLGDGSYQSISGSVTEPKLHEYLEQHIRIGSKREQILLSNEELVKDLQNNQQNQAVVKETIEFLRTELDNCERTQMKLNCSEEILANSVKRGCIMAMQKGKAGEWYEDDHVGGYFAKDGNFIICEEYGLSDADTDSHAADVQNGYGYYDSSGTFIRYGKEWV